MANGIANAIAQLGAGLKPATNFLQGQQASQQNRLAQMQMDQAQQQMTQQQRQQDIQTLGGLLQGVQDEQGYQQALDMAQRMGVGEQTLGGLKRTMPQFDPDKNQRLLSAYGFAPQKKDMKEIYGREEGLRKEYTKLSKPFMDVRDAFGRVIESSKKPSGAGDLALIFNYMKMLDPGSVVREGEFATAETASGVPTRIRSMYNKIVSGERLAPETRRDFFERAQMLYGRQQATQQDLADRYRALAERTRVSPENVVIDFGSDFGEMPTFGEPEASATEPQQPQLPRRPKQQPSKPAQPTSQADYDALPSGALFVDPDDGKTYRKP